LGIDCALSAIFSNNSRSLADSKRWSGSLLVKVSDPASSRSTVTAGGFLLFIDEFFNKNTNIGCSHIFSIQLQSNAI